MCNTTNNTTTTTFPSSILRTQIQNALIRISGIPIFSADLDFRGVSPLDRLVYPNKEGYTPLHYAAASANFEFAKSLIFIFVSLGRVDMLSPMDQAGRTPLHWAVDSGSLGIVQLLIENGVSPNSQDHDGLSPLHLAISKHSAELQNPNFPAEYQIPIRFAEHHLLKSDQDLQNPWRQILEYLISIVDINISDITGVSGLHLAAEFGDVETIRNLIENGAWVNIQDHQGENPLFYAVRGNQYEAIRVLVEEFGINMDLVNEDEEHILDLCRAIGQQVLTDLVTILYKGRMIHQKMVCCLQQEKSIQSSDPSAGWKYSGQNMEIISNHSGYIRLSGHSCA